MATMPTRRQLEVLRAKLETGTLDGASAALGRSRSSCKKSLSELYGRIGAVNEAQAVAWADDHLPGWRPPHPASHATAEDELPQATPSTDHLDSVQRAILALRVAELEQVSAEPGSPDWIYASEWVAVRRRELAEVVRCTKARDAPHRHGRRERCR